MSNVLTTDHLMQMIYVTDYIYVCVCSAQINTCRDCKFRGNAKLQRPKRLRCP